MKFFVCESFKENAEMFYFKQEFKYRNVSLSNRNAKNLYFLY